MHKSCLPIPKSALLVGHTNFFCNHTSQGQSVMFSLKLLLLKKTLQPLFVDMVQLLFFNTRSLGLPGAYLIDLKKKNGWVDLGATQLFSTEDAWIGNPAT